MVRHGNRPASPGCITMEEAIMLHQAMNGGPSGPGTGITRPAPRRPPIAQPREIMPGMDLLGLSGGRPSGFQQRFEQGINGLPATVFNPNEQMFGQGFDQGLQDQRGMFNPGVQGNPPLFGQPNSPFIDPTRNTPGRMNMMPPQWNADGLHFHSTPTDSHTHALPGDPGLGRGSRRAPVSGAGGGLGFPGEQTVPPAVSRRVGADRDQVARFNAREADLLRRFNVSESNVTRRTEQQSDVSALQEDAQGVYFLFYPRVGRNGIRVNFTKTGFCRRNAVTRERNLCMNMCYSDDQCPRELKCCPSGCSLGCLQPSTPGGAPVDMPADSSASAGRGGGAEAGCRICDRSADCPGTREYCYHSPRCRRRVCQEL